MKERCITRCDARCFRLLIEKVGKVDDATEEDGHCHSQNAKGEKVFEVLPQVLQAKGANEGEQKAGRVFARVLQLSKLSAPVSAKFQQKEIKVLVKKVSKKALTC